jgi:hypothetical protein
MRFRRADVRFRRRYLVILVLLMVLPLALIVISNSLGHPAPQRVSPAASPPSPYCRSGDPRAGVYNSSRIRVLANCQLASGVVRSTTLQDNRYQRIDVSLDAQYANLLDAGDVKYLNGQLALELIPPDQATISVPIVGQHIAFVGPWVYDTENHWNAIYPVWSITRS